MNNKQLYLMLKAQVKAKKDAANPTNTDTVNTIPENFNQIGWALTVEKVHEMLAKMNELYEIRGKRLTPQFYRSIYNRAIIAIGEAQKQIDALTADSDTIDYDAEITRLTAELYQLNTAEVAASASEPSETE